MDSDEELSMNVAFSGGNAVSEVKEVQTPPLSVGLQIKTTGGAVSSSECGVDSVSSELRG